MPTELPDSAKVLRNDVGKRMATALEAIAQGGGGGASVVQKTMAEYTALPTSEKMNGSIYKITDKALIYCLDEEYHAVLEITSADYALLTSDEKNNGTLYIITDEETTAADIPYSQGVSVADMLATIPAKYTSGDVITLSGGIGCGQLGYNKVIFFIPLAKQIDTSAVNTCTINLTLTVFGVRNDANVTVISSQSVTLDTAVITENGINLEVNNPNYQTYNSGVCWIKVEGTGTITLGHT